LALLALAGLLCASESYAQSRVQAQEYDDGGTAYSSGLGIGGHYSRVTNMDTDNGSDMFGGMVRLRGGVLGVEGAIDYRKDDLGAGVDLKTWPVTASLMIYPVPVVYGLAGLGWYNSTLDFPPSFGIEDETDTQLGYHVGAGLELPMAPAFALTGDVRWQFVDYDFEDIPGSIGNDADSWSWNAGFLFYLR
jgi:opacity protein-like surface antigen